MTLLEYHKRKCIYYLDELETVLDAEMDKHNRNTLLSMLKRYKDNYELHKRYVEELEGMYERIQELSKRAEVT